MDPQSQLHGQQNLESSDPTTPPPPSSHPQPDDPPTSHRAYLLTWDDHQPRACTRTALLTPDDVRAALSSPSPIITPAAADADAAAVAAAAAGPGDSRRQRLLVLHGLHRPLVDGLLGGAASHGVGVDPAFVECCALRRPYRPAREIGARARRRRWRRGQQHRQQPGRERLGFLLGPEADSAAWRVWEYPELVEGLESSFVVKGRGRDAAAGGGDGDEELGRCPPPVRQLAFGEDGKKVVGVVFCRASLWRGPGADVLFLDRPLWKKGCGADTGARKLRRKEVSVLNAREGGGGSSERETASLEDVLFDALRHGWEAGDDVVDILSETVYERWLELFDVLDLRPVARRDDDTMACYWQILRSLERNQEGAPDQAWTELLSRTQRRIALLTAPRDKPPVSPHIGSREKTARMRDNSKEKITRLDRVDSFPRGGVSEEDRDDKKAAEENRRALDRISYLGGILIPIPIVSGILSMNEMYSPEGSHFFVFWAVAIPLSILTVLIIHADTIRKAHVWVEIAADRVVADSDDDEDSGKADTDPTQVRLGQPPMDFLRGRARKYPDIEAGDDDEENTIGMRPPAVAMPSSDGEAPDTTFDFWAPHRSWRRMGFGELMLMPSVILERPTDGSKPRAWKRQELGWYGAIRSIVYKRPRDGKDVPSGVAASEKPAPPKRRKAKSY